MSHSAATPGGDADLSGFVLLDESRTRALVSMSDALEVCGAVMADLSEGRAVLSEPAAQFLKADAAAPTLFKVKGGHVPSLGACGFRIVGDVGPDGEIDEQHYCYLLDPRSAVPLGLIAQTHIHRLRTAASGLLAARLLAARPDPTVALIGAGRIGRCLAEGFAEAMPGARLLVASRRAESARAVATAVGGPVSACDSIAEAAAAADVVIALSTARSPIPGLETLREGQAVIGMGEYHELSHGLLDQADRFFADDLEFAGVLGSAAAWLDEGLLTAPALRQRLSGSVGAVVAGRVPGRTAPGERILAIVQGIAVADIALAELCRRRVRGEG